MEVLRLEDVTVFRGGRKILDRVNLRIFSESKFIVTGDNGAGKTTLVETIMGFVPYEGSIHFKGKKLRDEKDFAVLRKHVGYAFQNPEDQLFSPTVEDELAFAPLNLGLDREEVKERVEYVLSLFSLERIRKKSIFSLSGGEKRIVSIACILTMDPEVLILDEPTAGLDRETFSVLLRFLKDTEKAVMIVTHDERLVSALSWEVYLLENRSLTPRKVP